MLSVEGFAHQDTHGAKDPMRRPSRYTTVTPNQLPTPFTPVPTASSPCDAPVETPPAVAPNPFQVPSSQNPRGRGRELLTPIGSQFPHMDPKSKLIGLETDHDYSPGQGLNRRHRAPPAPPAVAGPFGPPVISPVAEPCPTPTVVADAEPEVNSIPEPGTLALVAIGIAGALVMRRRKSTPAA